MSAIIFARPRYDYDSYQDLYNLIQLSGFPLVYFDEVDPDSDNRYLLTMINGENQHGWQSPRAKIWHLNGEWCEYPPVPGLAGTFHFDRWYAGEIGARYVPLGSHPDLRMKADSTAPERYDVALLGYIIPRRQQMQHDLRQQGVTLSPSSAWGDMRHKLLSNSTVYGHVHQHDDKPGLPALRMVVAAAYAMPFVTESVVDAGMFSDVILQAPYNYYAGFVRDWLHGERAMLRDKGAQLHELLCCEFTFRASVEAVL